MLILAAEIPGKMIPMLILHKSSSFSLYVAVLNRRMSYIVNFPWKTYLP